MMKPNKKILIGIGILVLIALLAGWWIWSSQQTTENFVKLTVKVMLGNKEIQPNALVGIQSLETKTSIVEKKTDNEGIAVFNLPKGSYHVIATYKSYLLQLSPYYGEENVNLTSDTTINIILRGGM